MQIVHKFGISTVIARSASKRQMQIMIICHNPYVIPLSLVACGLCVFLSFYLR